MGDEVVDFAIQIGAKNLRTALKDSEFRGLFRRQNYFLLNNDTFLIVKLSQNKIRPFYGLGKKFLDFFNTLTEQTGTYFFVGLVSNKSGWVVSKKDILTQISSGAISFSPKQEEYKINDYNLKDIYSFTSIDGFLRKIGQVSRQTT